VTGVRRAAKPPPLPILWGPDYGRVGHCGATAARRALPSPPRIRGGGVHQPHLTLLLLVFFAAGCTSRFSQRDPAAAPATTVLNAGEGDTVKSGPPLRVNFAGLPAALSDTQAASLKRAWEAASGSPVEIVTSPNVDAGADVLIVSSATLADAVAAKQIVPPTDAAEAGAAEAGGDVPEAARRALTWKGTVYALPLAARLRVLVYDPARLRAAGVDDRPAPTLEGLRAQWLAAARSSGAAAAPLTADNKTPTPASPGSLTDDVALLAAAFGGGLVDEEGALAVASKPAVQAVEFLKGLRGRGLLPDQIEGAPFVFAYWDGLTADADDRPIAGLPPALAAYDPAMRPFVVGGEVFGVAISAGTKNRALAERFALFVSDPLLTRGLLGPRSLVPGAQNGDENTLTRLAGRLTVPGGPLAHARNRAILERYVRAALDNTLPVGEALAKAAAEIEGRPAPADAAPVTPPVSDKPNAAASAPASAGPPPVAPPAP